MPLQPEIILLIAAIVSMLLALFFLAINSYKRKTLKIRQQLFETLFSKVSGMHISHQDRANLTNDPYGLIYGEITFEGFSSMLAIVRPEPEEIFYDLGAGSGKAVFCAALLYDWTKCCGIEFLPGLHQLSINQHKKFQSLLQTQRRYKNKKYPIQLIHGDFLAQDISDAGVIFINATCFLEDFWQQVLEKLQSVKKGTRIMIASKRLDESQYHLLAAQMFPMSWGINSVNIYYKI